jgi:hypothetical protein
MSRVGEEKMPARGPTGKPQVLLAHHLKPLKLPTVLREYEKLARECARRRRSYPKLCCSLTSDASSYVNGLDLPVDAALTARNS